MVIFKLKLLRVLFDYLKRVRFSLIQQKPTVIAYPKFNAEQDAEVLKKAIKGLGKTFEPRLKNQIPEQCLTTQIQLLCLRFLRK